MNNLWKIYYIYHRNSNKVRIFRALIMIKITFANYRGKLNNEEIQKKQHKATKELVCQQLNINMAKIDLYIIFILITKSIYEDLFYIINI